MIYMKLNLKSNTKVMEIRKVPTARKISSIKGFTTKKGSIHQPTTGERAYNPDKLNIKNKSKIDKNDIISKTSGESELHPTVKKMDDAYNNIISDKECKSLLETMKTIDTSTPEGAAKYDEYKQTLSETILGSGFKGVKDKIESLIKSNNDITGINLLGNRSGIEASKSYDSDVQLTGGYINTAKDPASGSQVGDTWWNGHFKNRLSDFFKKNSDIANNISTDMGVRYSTFEFNPEWTDGNVPEGGSISPREFQLRSQKKNLYKNKDGETRFLEKNTEFTMLMDTRKLNPQQKDKLVKFLQTAAVSESQRSTLSEGDPNKHAWEAPDLRATGASSKINTSDMHDVYRHGIKFNKGKGSSVTPSGRKYELMFTTLSKNDKTNILKQVFGNDASIKVDAIKINKELHGFIQ